jgi:hypothetical protein
MDHAFARKLPDPGGLDASAMLISLNAPTPSSAAVAKPVTHGVAAAPTSCSS